MHREQYQYTIRAPKHTYGSLVASFFTNVPQCQLPSGRGAVTLVIGPAIFTVTRQETAKALRDYRREGYDITRYVQPFPTGTTYHDTYCKK